MNLATTYYLRSTNHYSTQSFKLANNIHTTALQRIMKISITLVLLSLVAFLQCSCTVAVPSTLKVSKASSRQVEPSAPKEDPSNSSASKQTVQGVITLNSRNFEASISDGNVWLVEFYSPWCGYVQRSTFNVISTSFKQSIRFSILHSSIDCTPTVTANDSLKHTN